MLRYLLLTAFLLNSLFAMADEADDTVTLTYVPQPDVTAMVELIRDRIKVKDGVETVLMTMAGSMRTQTSAHPDGLLARSDQSKFNIETEDEELREFMDPILEAMSSIDFSVVIADSGELTKLDGMKPLLESTRKAIDEMIETMPEQFKPMMNALVESSLNEEAMLRKAQKDWNLSVMQWQGGELQKGYAYEVEYGESVSEFGNLELGLETRACRSADKSASREA